jgi:hypothetical protein
MGDNEALVLLVRLAREKADECVGVDLNLREQCILAANIADRMLADMMREIREALSESEQAEAVDRIRQMISRHEMDKEIHARKQLRGEAPHGPQQVWIARDPSGTLKLFEKEPYRWTPEDQGGESASTDEWWWTHHEDDGQELNPSWFTAVLPAGEMNVLKIRSE